MLLTLLHPIVLGAALRVQGDLGCPAPNDVSANVQAIVDLSEASAAQVVATLRREGPWLELELSDAQGAALGKRSIEAGEDCAALARTAAVVLAAWLSEEHPEFLVALPSPAPAAPSTPGSPSSPSSPSSPTQATRDASKPAAPPTTPPRSDLVVSKPRATTASPAPSNDRHRLALAAAIGGSTSGSQFATLAWLGVSLDPGERGLGVQLSAAWIGAHSEPLQPHEVRWTRWPLMAGPYLRFISQPGTFDLELGPALGWLRLEGQDFSPNAAHGHATFGGYASLRFMPKAGSWHPFVMATPVLWFGRTTAFATSGGVPSSETTLPSVDLLFSVGARFLP